MSDLVIKGSLIGENEVVPLSRVQHEGVCVSVEGEIIAPGGRDTRSGKQLICFVLSDLRRTGYTPGHPGDAITVKLFRSKELEPDYLAQLTPGRWVRVRGRTQLDAYTGELTLLADDICAVETPLRSDRHNGLKRVELNVKTKYSAMDALTDPAAVIRRAAEWGHRAVAITDHGVVQAFPAAAAAKVPEGFKVLYGAELWVVDDAPEIVSRPPRDLRLSEAEFVVVDIETTGFSPIGDDIIEIGAVRVKAGNVAERLHSFVRPSKPIPPEVQRLTGITQQMVEDAPEAVAALRKFFEFARGAILVAHNAAFDFGFLRYHGRKHFGDLPDYAVLDTLMLSRALLPNLRSFSLENVCREVGVRLSEHHRADADAEATAEVLLALLKRVPDTERVADLNRLAANLKVQQSKPYAVTVIVQAQPGVKNLYKLISLSHTEYFHRVPRVPRSVLENHREGLLLGSAGLTGQLYQALLQGLPESDLRELVRAYDYLEILPPACLKHLLDTGQVRSLADLEALNVRIYELGHQLGKPVVAVGDVHFLDPHEQIHRHVLKDGIGFRDGEVDAPLFFRTTEEMLAEFAHLGPERAVEVVITNPNHIADLVEPVEVIPRKMHSPVLPGSEEEVVQLCYERARSVYGDPLPEKIERVLKKELDAIIRNGYAVSYYIAHLLVRKSEERGYLVGSRGSVGSSFAAWCLGITEVNPLPPHYVCPVCQYVEWHDDGTTRSGYDLPDKECPSCHFGVMKGDGQDIPFETFLGFKGEKIPDIDLNFSGVIQNAIQKYVEELLGGPQYVFKAGTISTIAERSAYGMAKRYLEQHGMAGARDAVAVALAAGLVGVKRSTGQHPGGMVVVPQGMEVEEVTPIQYPANDVEAGVRTTHFDYHAFEQALMKLDILGHDDPTMLKILQDLMRERHDPNFDIRDIPMNDPQVLGLFRPGGNRVLGIEDGVLQFDLGTIVLPEMGTRFVRQLLMETAPANFSDLVRVSGLSHGTDVWTNNAQTLVQEGVADFQSVIGCRDDIMVQLIYWGVEPATAFKIMESVRKGKGLTDEMQAAMRAAGVPEWYIWSCERIKYLFPKAHASAYVLNCLRIAWFKVYYPLEFYSAHFTVRAAVVDGTLLASGLDAVQAYMAKIEAKGRNATPRELDALVEYEAAVEAFLRGIRFKPVDLYRSAAHQYLIDDDDSILCPFSSLPGIGEAAAEAIVAARAEGPFVSVADLQRRARLNRSAIELLRECGALKELPETNQMTFVF